MRLSHKFIAIAERKPWADKFKAFVEEYGKIVDGTYIVPDSKWDDFLVDVGRKKSRGLGDTIAKITKTVGIKECGGCSKRRKLLNKVVKYKK